MFTGIIECMGSVVKTHAQQGNLHLTIESPITQELKIDQSVSHNGVCLTVVSIEGSAYTVTAIAETLAKTNIGLLKVADKINLERCMQMNGRLDGHIVQGHVDQTAVCAAVEETEGSWLYTFTYDKVLGNVTVEKGSICVNGVSLTVVNSQPTGFSVAVIPYTHAHTNFSEIKKGTVVNLEFDIIGKYVKRLMELKS